MVCLFCDSLIDPGVASLQGSGHCDACALGVGQVGAGVASICQFNEDEEDQKKICEFLSYSKELECSDLVVRAAVAPPGGGCPPLPRFAKPSAAADRFGANTVNEA
jgi:hypothetical protein